MEEKTIELEENEEHHISPGVLALIAVISIGGLLFIGWQASTITGNVLSGPYYACCTVQPWGSSASGYRQGVTQTNTELCDQIELPNRCCVRAGRERYNSPVNLVSSSFGTCSPAKSYPAYYQAGQIANYRACCTVQSYQRSPVGYTQGTAETTTENCELSESLFECCARAGTDRLNLPVRVLGLKEGDCNAPEVSYPLGQVDMRGYSACCSFETWRNSPIGYTQGETMTRTGYCDDLESVSQCCIRTGTLSTNYPIKLIGSKMGGCQQTTPESSYPIWIR